MIHLRAVRSSERFQVNRDVKSVRAVLYAIMLHVRKTQSIMQMGWGEYDEVE